MYGWKLISGERLPVYGLFSEVTKVGKARNTMWFMEMSEGLKALSER